MNKILVTGGCGFIGANLIPMLIAKGFDVRVLDNLSKGSKQYVSGCNVEIHEGDIRNELDVAKALVGVDGIIHLAAFGSVVESVTDPVENFDNNTKGTFVLLNESRKAGVKKFIFSSTGGALIGNAVPPVNESSVPRPISPYGSSKLCCEAYCSSFAHSYDMSITALRFANVIGPVSWHKKGAVTAFMKALLNEKPITIYGDGSATRDFLYVNDLCGGIISAYEKSLTGFNPIHLASGREVSVKELAEAIMVVAGSMGHAIEYLDTRVGEVEKNFATYDHAKDVLGFEPSVSLKEGLEKTWQWFVDEHAKS
jgi:UDP-glucose 4-epimerase